MKRQIWLTILFITLVSLLGVGRPALAQESEPQNASPGLTVFTRYPAQEIAIGNNATFDFTLRTGSSPQTVRLDIKNLPEGWMATFRGGGKIVQAAYVELKNDTSVELRVEPPKDVSPGTYRFAVIAQGEKEKVEFPIELIVKEKLPPKLKFEVELPRFRGTPETTFRYNVDLKNEGDEDLPVNLLAETPRGFQAKFKLLGKDVTNIPLPANEKKRLEVEVQAYAEVPAGEYPINIMAQGNEAQAATTLIAEVTGQPALSITAPDGRLSGKAYVGKETSLKLVVQNTGSAPARGIELSASQPSGWTVGFEPQKIAEIPSGQFVEVTAKIRPSDQAVAGDYMVTIRARPEEGASKSADFRITVLTSTLWGVVGVVLIAVAVGIVGLAVMRFGRR